MTDFKLVPLKEIKPDPNQPRKYYDEVAMQELVASVKEKGILQPILIRPNGKGKILVCGERRYRAATAAGLTEIPAVIREMTDEEALELQIIENLQRKDVHPMEEAVAFQALVEKGKEVKDIAARVGKSDFYVRQRIKLCSLIKEWRQAYFHHRITNKEALELSLFDNEIQKELWENEGSEGTDEIELDSWTLSKYKGRLSEAIFPLDDVTIDKKAGACTSCTFNTAFASLFPDASENPRCAKISCFSKKTEVQFLRELDKAKEDVGMLFINDSYYAKSKDPIIESLQKEGHTVLNGRNDSNFEILQVPERPSLEDFDRDDYESERELQAAFEKELKSYEADLQKYNDAITGSKYKKAFVVVGDNRGTYRYIKLGKQKGTTGKQLEQKEEAGTVTVDDIKSEIERIKAKESRSCEIDENKFWEALRPSFEPMDNLLILEGPLTDLERVALAHTITECLPYGDVTDFESLFTDKKGNYGNVTEAQLLKMLRFLLLSKLPPRGLFSGFTETAKLCIDLAKIYYPSIVAELTEAKEEKSLKRKDRVKKRLAELNDQLKMLKKSTSKTK